LFNRAAAATTCATSPHRLERVVVCSGWTVSFTCTAVDGTEQHEVAAGSKHEGCMTY
jgi:hypothetical protein